MKRIELTQGKMAVVDDDDYSSVVNYTWAYHARDGYAIATPTTPSGRKTVYMHRLIMKPPAGKEVDHINGDGLDNRRENLRVVTHAENMKNHKVYANNKTGYSGVRLTKSGRYTASIRINRKARHLGTFDNAQEASAAYQAEAAMAFGAHVRNLIEREQK